MKSVLETLNLWLNKRFIFIVEVFGYAASVIMGIGIIYCLLTYEDVLAHANGTLTPLSEPLTVVQEYVVYDWLIEPAADVKAGAPVARVVTEAQAVQRLCATRYLSKAGASLDQLSDSSVRARQFVNDALEELKGIPPTETVFASIRGTIILQQDSKGTVVLAPGTSLAMTYDLEVVLFMAELEARKAKNVKEGQEARVKLEGLDEFLVGRVIGEPEAKEGGAVQLRFEQIPREVQDVLRDKVTAEPVAFPKARAEIVVGRRSLFVKLFGRSS